MACWLAGWMDGSRLEEEMPPSKSKSPSHFCFQPLERPVWNDSWVGRPPGFHLPLLETLLPMAGPIHPQESLA